MYENYWQLQRRPFENLAEAGVYYPSEIHQGSLLKLRYAIESRRGAALLVGPPGCGKTLVVQLLRRQLGDSFGRTAHLVFPKMPVAQLIAHLADELGAGGAAEGGTIDVSLRHIRHQLTETAKAGKHTMVAIDEAHLIDNVETLEALRLLLNFEYAGQPLLTLLLVGQASLLPTLDRMRALEERLAVKCLLRALTLEETVSYVNHRLTAAGAERTIFEPAALETLHELTQGAPRRINRLCDLALLVGYAEERRTITAEQFEAVSEDLVTIGPM